MAQAMESEATNGLRRTSPGGAYSRGARRQRRNGMRCRTRRRAGRRHSAWCGRHGIQRGRIVQRRRAGPADQLPQHGVPSISVGRVNSFRLPMDDAVGDNAFGTPGAAPRALRRAAIGAPPRRSSPCTRQLSVFPTRSVQAEVAISSIEPVSMRSQRAVSITALLIGGAAAVERRILMSVEPSAGRRSLP